MTTEKIIFFQNYIQDNLVIFFWSGNQEIYDKLDEALEFSNDLDYLKKALDTFFTYEIFNKEQAIISDEGYILTDDNNSDILLDRVILKFKTSRQ